MASTDAQRVDEDVIDQAEVERLAGMKFPAKLEFCIIGNRHFHRINGRLWAEYPPYPEAS